MKDRNTELLGSWLGVVTLGERTLRPIGVGVATSLKALRNPVMSNGDEEVSLTDMVEVAYIMYCNQSEISAYARKEKDQRYEIIGMFAIDHVDEIDLVINEITTSLSRVKIAAMESNNSGKETSHAY